MQKARCLALFYLAACAYAIAPGAAAKAQHRETLEVVSSFHGKPLRLPVQVYLPDKPAGGKIPAMIIMHGSGGVRDIREGAYARAFNALGLAAVVIDSFTPRGVRSTVNDQSKVTEADMLADAGAILKAIAARPQIDRDRIGLIGFSKGGTVAIKAALQRYGIGAAKDDAHFSVLIALYPWCGDMPLDFTPAGASLAMLLGADDTYAGTAACREYAGKFAAAGGKLTLEVYPGARHGWDVPGPVSWRMSRAQNSSRCINDEVQGGRWIERSSGLTVFINGAPAPEEKKAKSRCRTIGASGGYDAATAKRSMQDIRAVIRAAFRTD